jgi:YaaC-like Protein
VRASAAVMIDKAIGTKTTQRLSLQARGDGLALCTWPAELKPQAQEMYQAARQAERLFGAAADAGVMTKPLQLYYGISQAGRAIAAVAPNVPDRQQGKPERPWKLSGHGIAIPAMHQSIEDCHGSVGLLPVADKGSGAFTQLAEVLGCGSLVDKKPDGSPAARVTIGEIWGTLPECIGFLLAGVLRFPMLAVEPYGPISMPRGTGRECGTLEPVPDVVKEAGTPEALKEFLAHYPDAGSWTMPSESLGISLADMWSSGRVHAQLNVLALMWPPGPSKYADDNLSGIPARIGSRYLGDAYLFPALGDNVRPLHPLLAWWAVLYALSMVARYEPVAWTEMTSINSSTEAAKIEFLLDAATRRLPRVILDVIDDLTSRARSGRYASERLGSLMACSALAAARLLTWPR